MKILFISDIHGIDKNMEYIENRFNDLECDRLIVLGDLFNGPKYLDNYNPDKVLKILNKYSDKIICMKGNCDDEIDMNKCHFDVNKGLLSMEIDSYNFYFNHGNVYNYDNLKNIDNGVLIYGHEHIPYIRKKNSVLCINPGSISLPRGFNKESYIYYDNGKFIIFDIDDNIIDEYSLS